MPNNPKILVVDDEPLARITIQTMLEKEEYALTFAENGEEALTLAPLLKPDIILLDVLMPGISGFETCKQIRQTPGLEETPIIMVTSLDDRESLLAGLKAGADDFLTKPFDFHQLRLRLQNMASLHRYRKQTLYSAIELQFYEDFMQQNSRGNEECLQRNALKNISDYVEAEEAILLLFDSDKPETARRKQLNPENGWKREDTLRLRSSPLCANLPPNLFTHQYHPRNLAEIDPVFNQLQGKPVQNVLVAPLSVNQTLLGAMIFTNPLFQPHPEERRTRFLHLMVSGVANALFALENTRRLLISKAELEASQWEILNSRNTLRTFFDNIPTCVYIIDRGYRIIALNERRAQILGKQPNDLVGEVCYKALHGLDSPCPLCRVSDAFRGIPAVRNLREWGAQDTFTHWEITTIPIREHEDTIHRVIVFDEDITEKWILETNLMESEKLASIGQLAANVAHEINNPLAAIIANAQLLLRDLHGADPDTLDSLRLIESAGVRAAKIVGSLLESARKERRDEFDEFSLNESIEDALSMLNLEIKKRAIHIRLDLAQDLPVIYAHKNQLKGVWINLLTNALGAIESETGVITISSRYQNGQYTILFTDNGSGIAPENQKHIFKPFFTTKKAGKGTGLGLYVSSQVVKDHHGEIYFETQPGKGTKFIIRLPDARGEEGEP